MPSEPLFDLFYRKVRLPDLQGLAEKYDAKNEALCDANTSVSASAKEEMECKYNPYRLSNPQNYSPIYDRIFVLNQKNYNCVGLNCDAYMKGGDVVDADGNVVVPFDQIHVKSSPLVDPFHYLSGKYDKYDNQICALPQYFSTEEEKRDALQNRLQRKINDPANSSYVDAFFSYLASKLKRKYNVFGAVDYYGVCCGIQDVFRYDIEEDISYLYSIDFFNENLGKRFFVANKYLTRYADEYMNIGSRANKFPLVISDGEDVQIELDDIEIMESDSNLVPPLHATASSSEEKEELVYDCQKERGEERADAAEYSSSSDESESSEEEESASERESNAASESGSDWETVDDDSEESSGEESGEESGIYAYIHKFPVQLIFMEKCDGTIDQLIMDGVMDDPHIFAAAFMQIIMTLITYQKAFQFTHNDLHTNNILYKKTDAEHLFYKYAGQIYKVPTYGRIFKIIDFGRSIYKFNGETFCSDSYSRGADAYGQYNCEPYFNPDKPRIDPNYSFDLARLGSSIYDFLDKTETDEAIFSTIKRWCTDDSGKNIVNKPNGEERWPGFKLYKMIALKVHKHLPQAQLQFPLFQQFATRIGQESVDGKWMCDIDSIAQ